MNWYLMFVQTGYEDRICRYINQFLKDTGYSLHYRLLVPKRTLYERKNGEYKKTDRLMFPGYILVETNQIEEFYYSTKNAPHVIRFIKEKDHFSQIAYEEICKILYLIDESGKIPVSQAICLGEKVVVTKGPLLGNEGIIRKVNRRKSRAKVELLINFKPYLIDLGLHVVKKEQGSEHEPRRQGS